MGDQQKVAHRKGIRPEGVSDRKGTEIQKKKGGGRSIMSWREKENRKEAKERGDQRYTQVNSHNGNIYNPKESKKPLNEFK